VIGTVLQELKESAEAQLPGWIEYVATHRSVALDSTITTYSWWKTEAEALKLAFPAVSFRWDKTITGQRNNVNARRAKHRITVSYGYRSGDMAAIERHITYVAEALLLWLDDLPNTSRSSGKTIIGFEKANDEEFEISHDLEKGEGGVFIWALDIPFTLTAQDSGLPPRTPRASLP
jgi:hypothetical protein